MLSSDLRQTIQSFVDAAITVRELEEWIVPRLPTFLLEPDSTDAELVSAVELGLAELSSSIQDVSEFRAALLQMLRNEETIVLRSSSTSTSTGARHIRSLPQPARQEPAPSSITWVRL